MLMDGCMYKPKTGSLYRVMPGAGATKILDYYIKGNEYNKYTNVYIYLCTLQSFSCQTIQSVTLLKSDQRIPLRLAKIIIWYVK